MRNHAIQVHGVLQTVARQDPRAFLGLLPAVLHELDMATKEDAVVCLVRMLAAVPKVLPTCGAEYRAHGVMHRLTAALVRGAVPWCADLLPDMLEAAVIVQDVAGLLSVGADALALYVRPHAGLMCVSAQVLQGLHMLLVRVRQERTLVRVLRRNWRRDRWDHVPGAASMFQWGAAVLTACAAQVVSLRRWSGRRAAWCAALTRAAAARRRRHNEDGQQTAIGRCGVWATPPPCPASQ